MEATGPQQPQTAEGSHQENSKSDRGWVWRSTVSSVEEGKISVVALVETLIAAGVYLWITWMVGTTPLVFSVCIAPFLLLRTRYSTRIGLSFGLRYADWLTNYDDSKIAPHWLPRYLLIPYVLFILFPITTVLIGIGLFVIKIIATTYGGLTYPAKTLSQIPKNWWRHSAVIDAFYPVEFLPGIEAHCYNSDYMRLAMLRPHIHMNVSIFTNERDFKNLASQFLLCLVIAPVYLIMFTLPAVLYRFSLKGTSLIYSPLIWIIHSSTRAKLPETLVDICKLVFYRLMRIFSAWALLLFLGKILIFNAQEHFSVLTAQLPHTYQGMLEAITTHELFVAYVAPHSIPPWQWAAVINALIAWGLYVFADWALANYERGTLSYQGAVLGTLRFSWFIRGLLSLYTIACTIYIAATLSDKFKLPPLGDKLFPWGS